MPRGLDLKKVIGKINELQKSLLDNISLLKWHTHDPKDRDTLVEMRRQVIDLAACLTSGAEEMAKPASVTEEGAKS